MKRIESELLYKNRKEYEDMIRRLENDMQFNSKKFSAHEESRILHDIANHKRGIVLLEQYNGKKHLYEELRESRDTKKQALDNAVNRIMDLKRQQIPSCQQAMQVLTREIDALKNEITELTNQRMEYKKQIEDHIKENIVKQQQAKKAIKEQHQMEKMRIKQDEVLVDMEGVQKDYNKLIAYFHKLTTSSSMESVSPCNDNSSRLSVARASSSLAQAQTPLSVSASSPSFSQSFNNQSSSTSSSTSSLLSLSLSTSNNPAELLSNEISSSSCSSPCSSKLNTCKSADSQLKLAPPNTLGINFQLQTSTLGESSVYTFKSPIDEFGGCFVMKQKIDDENQNRKRNWKKSKQKSFKVSHPMEVINLLIKMNVPIHLSSQFDECLKLLVERREAVSRQLDMYRAQKLAEMKTTASSSGNLQGASSSLHSDDGRQQASDRRHSDASRPRTSKEDSLGNAGGSHLFPDNNSEISSCLDSNYDSDTSVNQRKSSSANETGKFDASMIENFLSRQTTMTNASANSQQTTGTEDLQAVTDQLLREQDMKSTPDSGEAKRPGAASSSRSSSPNTPTNNHQIEEETVTFSPPSSIAVPSAADESQEVPVSETVESNECLKLNVTKESSSKTLSQSLLRQLSDGYSSSCSPLSASSINNEQPSVNPFFQDITSNTATSSSSAANDSSSDDTATPPIKMSHHDKEKSSSDLKKGHSGDEIMPPASIIS